MSENIAQPGEADAPIPEGVTLPSPEGQPEDVVPVTEVQYGNPS